MRTAGGALISLLQTSKIFYMGEIYAFTLVSGEILRHTSLDIDISYGGYTYASKGLLLKRSRITLVRGIQVDQLEIEAYPTTETIGGIGFLQAARNGALDGGWVQLDRLFFSGPIPDNPTPVDGITLFYGKISEIELGRTQAKIRVASILELLNVQWPQNLYMPSCIWNLYSAGCGANKTSKTVSGTVAANSTISVIKSNLSQANNYFDQGVIHFTSGSDTGISRTVKSYAQSAGQVSVILPLPYAPAANSTFTIYPGCDKSSNTCANRFSNANNFRGMPYIPTPETGL